MPTRAPSQVQGQLRGGWQQMSVKEWLPQSSRVPHGERKVRAQNSESQKQQGPKHEIQVVIYVLYACGARTSHCLIQQGCARESCSTKSPWLHTQLTTRGLACSVLTSTLEPSRNYIICSMPLQVGDAKFMAREHI